MSRVRMGFGQPARANEPVMRTGFPHREGAGGPRMSEAEIRAEIRKMVERIVEQFHPRKVILFGSHAREAGTEDSDVDLIVVMPVKGSKRRQASEIDRALADRLLPLDLIVVTPEEFDR
ncbi:MAG TPA: nucleotidyltransferase domain-containing protein, partial [Bryobacterales bacterium]|nr:nucleotidyltransferase domain-containing protein [Bryobacterales bacterium]